MGLFSHFEKQYQSVSILAHAAGLSPRWTCSRRITSQTVLTGFLKNQFMSPILRDGPDRPPQHDVEDGTRCLAADHSGKGPPPLDHTQIAGRIFQG